MEWAESEEIDKDAVLVFVKEDIFMDVMPNINEPLLDSIGISRKEVKATILAAARKLDLSSKIYLLI